jgi:hypothetical protein
MQYYWGLPMSADDKAIAAGRIVIKRAEAKKQLALLQGNQDALGDLKMLLKLLSPGYVQNYESGLRSLISMIEHGGRPEWRKSRRAAKILITGINCGMSLGFSQFVKASSLYI